VQQESERSPRSQPAELDFPVGAGTLPRWLALLSRAHEDQASEPSVMANMGGKASVGLGLPISMRLPDVSPGG